MFTAAERERLRDELIAAAREDVRIASCAITGSGASGREDRWSDIDLALAVRGAGEIQAVLTDWTEMMVRNHAALDHVDVTGAGWIYRVFLLPSTLQVDLAFAAAKDFGARASTFQLVFGTAAEVAPFPPPTVDRLIGWGWLYALHARSCIARGKWWQAEYMISALRDQVLALACLRHGLPANDGRGMDRLPADVLASLEPALVRHLTEDQLTRALGVALGGLQNEVSLIDDSLAMKLRSALAEIARVRQDGD